MSVQKFDIAIIGSGPGGYVAAIRAAQLGMKVAVIEREHIGGICLNWGCIPAKALLRSSDVYRNMKHAAEYGLKAEKFSFDLAAIVKRSRGVSAQLSQGVGYLFKKNKITVIDGHGKLNGAGKIVVEKDGKKVADVEAAHIIVATGARARHFPGLEPDHKLVWTYKDALVADTMPKKLLVIGSGAIGIEFASFFNALESDVTVVEVMDRVVPAEDAEISALAEKSFKKQGMDIRTKTMVKALDKKANSVVATLEKDGKTQQVEYDRVILAVGVVPNTENVGLETTKVKLDKRGIIEVDEYMQTHEPGIYAIGDVTEGPWLAHKASHEGIICVEKIKGLQGVHGVDRRKIPGCTYCHPQIASVGLTEAKAKELGYELKVGRFPFIGNGKAIAMGEPEGLIKTVFDAKTGELLGAHMIGAEVTEMIQGLNIAMNLETTEEDLMHTIFPHPTISESIHESILDAYGRVLHI
ncbi:MAG: dihydrolipoyl dehydrogenase [Alphaproteobacteria bacterium]